MAYSTKPWVKTVITEPTKASEVRLHLTMREGASFHFRNHLCVVPNVSFGLLPWEADLLVLRNSLYMDEVEIKVSASDWKKDASKHKFNPPEYAMGSFARAWPLIRRLWYAAPMSLAQQWQHMGIPEYAGVLGVNSEGCHEIKRAAERKDSRKLTHEEAMKLCRLGAMRHWDLLWDAEQARVTKEHTAIERV